MVVIVVMIVMGLGRAVIRPSVGFFHEMIRTMRHGAGSAVLGEAGFPAAFERSSTFAAELVATAIAVVAYRTGLRGLGIMTSRIVPNRITPR